MPFIQPGAGEGPAEARRKGQRRGRELGSPVQQGPHLHEAGRWDLAQQVPRSAQEPLAGGSRGQEQELPERGLTWVR